MGRVVREMGEAGMTTEWQQVLQRLAEETGARLAAAEQRIAVPAARGQRGAVWPSGPVDRWWFALVPEGEFLAAAYAVVLGRAVDASGAAAYSGWTGSWLGRIAVLAALVESPEGRSKGAAVAGVRRWARVWHVLQRWGAERLSARLSDLLWRRDALRALAFGVARWEAAEREEEAEWARWRAWGEGVAQALERLEAATAKELGRLFGEVGRLNEEVAAVRTTAVEGARLVAASERGGSITEAGAAGSAGAASPVGEAVVERFYRDLEDSFRDAALVTERVRGYLPWVAPYLGELVVDLGCGRGDWLAVAQGHGHRVLGVEPSKTLAEEAVARGVPVVVADGLEWLRGQPEGSVAVVSALHVLEHLPFAAVLAWLIEAFRVVRPGGLVFFETPNPENGYVATHHFFNDPTHLRPLTPELLAFALRWAGFDAVEVVRLHPLPGRIEASDPASERLNGWLHGAQDFCVRGVKR